MRSSSEPHENDDRDLAPLFYRRMALIRAFEETVLHLFGQNVLSGTSHTCIGQEADAVGVIHALDRARDAVWSNHRGHGHFLAYCDNVEGLLAEIMGKQTGVCGGRGGSQHLCFQRFYSNGVLGGIAPNAVGTAFALKASGAVTAVFLGDGAMGEGVVYESLNLASLWDLPVLFVVEDNGIAQTTPRSLSVRGSIANRAEPFGLRCFSYSGTNALEIHRLARQAVDHVRNESKPAWLYLETVRLGPHSKGDDTRAPDEMARLRRSDPLQVLRPLVPEWAALEKECAQRIQSALEKVNGDPPACA